MSETMGYQNAYRVYDKTREGLLLKPRGGKLTLNTTALAVLQYMATTTYDWPPDRKVRSRNIPCRYYARGWRNIAETLGMICLSPEQILDADSKEASEKALGGRENTAKVRITDAWRFLREKGLIKQLVPASLGKNAGYLLLLGDDDENRRVEEYARQCLGLPFKD